MEGFVTVSVTNNAGYTADIQLPEGSEIIGTLQKMVQREDLADVKISGGAKKAAAKATAEASA